MKKTVFLGLAALALLATSCKTTTTTATSRVAEIETELVSPQTAADLVISEKKVSYTYHPLNDTPSTGEKTVLRTAVAETLKQVGGNADVLVQPQYEVKRINGKIVEVVVTGYPATYKNFRVLPIK